MEDVSTMIDKLGTWASTTQVLLATLEVRGAWIRTKRPNGTSMLLPPLSTMRCLPPIVRTIRLQKGSRDDRVAFWSQGSVEAAAESRRQEAQTAQTLALEAAEVKKGLTENAGKQRDVSRVSVIRASLRRPVPL